MAAVESSVECNGLDGGPVLKTGHMYKQGGSYRSWKKRYFVLYETFLSYYAKEGDCTPKGNIDLTLGRGIRLREQCSLDWPKSAKPGLAFGLAVDDRTYYLYGDNCEVVKDWMTIIQQCIIKVGQPTDDFENDPEGKKEGQFSKCMKRGAKLASKVTKMVVKNAGIDENIVSIVEGVADAVENQADAGRDATFADRLKMAVGDAAGIVGDNVDVPGVSVVADVVQQQCEEDMDLSIQSRLFMGAGAAAKGTIDTFIDEGDGNEGMKIAGGALLAAGSGLKDKANIDTMSCIGMSSKGKLAFAGSSAIGVKSKKLGATMGKDVQPLMDALDVTSGVKCQAIRTSPKKKGMLAISSASDGLTGVMSSPSKAIPFGRCKMAS